MIDTIRDLNAEATAVYEEAYTAAYVAAANWGGSDEAEAIMHATGAGRDAEDVFWAQVERDAQPAEAAPTKCAVCRNAVHAETVWYCMG
jgi:hypothetical protein